MHLIKPFFVTQDHITHMFPQVAEEGHRDSAEVERYDHIAGDGSKCSYHVGSRDFLEVTFRWQSDTKKGQWETFWDAVKDGSPFYYVIDDSIRKFGDGGKFGDAGFVFGDDSDGDAGTWTLYTFENMELPVQEEEIYGYWQVGPLRMRAVV